MGGGGGLKRIGTDLVAGQVRTFELMGEPEVGWGWGMGVCHGKVLTLFLGGQNI